MPPLHIPTQRLAHIKRVLAGPRLRAGRRIVAVVLHDAAEDRIPQAAVQADGDGVAGAHEQVDEVGGALVAGALERLREHAREPEAPRRRAHGQRRDVRVPGQRVRRVLQVGRGGLEFAHYCEGGLARGGRGGESGRTVAVDGAGGAFGDVEEVGPFGEVGEVEVEAVGFGEGVEVGGVELEDVHGFEGADGCHFGGLLLFWPCGVYGRR